MLSSTEASNLSTVEGINPETCAPALRWDVRFGIEGAVPFFECNDTEYLFEEVSYDDLARLVPFLDGRRSVSKMAAESGISVDFILAIVEQLLELEIAVDLGAESDEYITPEAFTGACRRLYPVWKERLFRHPLWVQLGTGEATKNHFLGWLIEQFHFLDGVNDRLASAIFECADSRVKPLFVKHYTEEFDHSYFFMAALNALQIDAKTVYATRPLPSTIAILNHLRRCARRGPLEYAVCSGFLESTGTDRTRSFNYFETLEKNYTPGRPEVLAPLAEHMRLDEAYGHSNLMEAMCERMGPIPRMQASAALAAGALFVETLELWSTDVLNTYAKPNSAPRLSLHQYR